MELSLFSFLTTLLWSSIIILILYFQISSTQFINKYGIYFTLLPILICIIRFIFPIEFFFTIVIPSPVIYTKLYNYLQTCIFGITVLNYLIFIWIAGAIILLFKLIVKYKIFKKSIDLIPSSIDPDDILFDVLNAIMQEYNLDKNIQVKISDEFLSPFLVGYLNPIIVIPNIDYSENELYYILKHEVTHFINNDLWIKLAANIVCIAYWWNPFIYLLNKILSQLLEIKCDLYLAQQQSAAEKIAYLQTIIKTLKQSQYQKQLSLTSAFITFNNSKKMKQRFELILNSAYKPNFTKILFYSLVILVTSLIFVVQPEYNSAELFSNEEGIVFDMDTSIVIQIDQNYFLYCDNKCVAELSDEHAKTLILAGFEYRKE